MMSNILMRHLLALKAAKEAYSKALRSKETQMPTLSDAEYQEFLAYKQRLSALFGDN